MFTIRKFHTLSKLILLLVVIFSVFQANPPRASLAGDVNYDSYDYSYNEGAAMDTGDVLVIDNKTYIISNNRYVVTDECSNYGLTTGYTVAGGAIPKQAWMRVHGTPDDHIPFTCEYTVYIAIQSADDYQITFNITYNNVNEAPDDITIDKDNVDENKAIGTLIGDLNASDPDVGEGVSQSHTFSLRSAAYCNLNDCDNEYFSITGDDLYTSASFDFETKSSYKVAIQAADAGGLSYTKILTIQVNDVNEAPTGISLSASTVKENRSSGTVVGSLSSSDPDAGDTFSYSLVGGLAGNSSFAIISNVLQTARSFDYEAQTSYVIRVRSADQGGLYKDKDFTITIGDVNEAPEFSNANPSSITAVEDGSQQLTVTATDPEGSTVAYSVVEAAEHGSASLSGNKATYTPAANFNGLDSFTVRASDGSMSSTLAVNVTVTPVNDAPLLDNSGNMALDTILEDPAANNGTAVEAIIASATGDRITEAAYEVSPIEGIAVSAVNGANGTWQYSINNGVTWSAFGSPSATQARLLSADTTTKVRFTPNQYWNTDWPAATLPFITFRAWDQTSGSNGSTASASSNGGTTAFSTNTENATITVTSVNNAPTFQKSANYVFTLNEGAGVQSLPGWATQISPGPQDEVTNGQKVHFNIVLNTDSGMFSVQPAINATGLLSYTPGTDEFGYATVLYNLQDDGGVANEGEDTSDMQFFKVIINPVNDAPSFVKGADQTVNEDAGAKTVNGWASSISSGPANESDQEVSFIITSNSNESLFDAAKSGAAPAIDANGKLTYRAATNANGIATVCVKIHDSGGVLYGGVNESAEQCFKITVNAVNDTPTGISLSANTVQENLAAGTVVGDLSTTDVDTGDTFTYSLVGGLTGNSSFTIAGNVLKTGVSFNYEAKSSYAIRVRSADSGGLYYDKDLTISISNVNEAPVISNANPSLITLAEDSSKQLTVTATDPEGGVLAYSVLESADHGAASFSGNKVTYIPNANYNGADSFTVNVSDGVFSTTLAVNVTVSAVNDAPVNTELPEVTGKGYVFETLSASDGEWNDDADLAPGQISISYQWQRADDSLGGGLNDISGANVAQYTLGAADSGKYVRIKITASDNGEGTPASQATVAYSAYMQIEILNLGVSVGAFSMEQGEDIALHFSSSDFASHYTPISGGPLERIRLMALPEHGDLFLDGNTNNEMDNGEAVGAGMEILAADLDKLIYLADSNWFGADAFRWNATDGPANGYPLPNTGEPISVTIHSINDIPTVAAPEAFAVHEDSDSLPFSFTLGDVDTVLAETQAANYEVTLADRFGAFSLASTAGLTFLGGADQTAAMTVSGTLANLQTAFDGVIYHPKAHYTGQEDVSIAIRDNGNSGQGEPLSATDSLIILISDVNNAPDNLMPEPFTVDVNSVSQPMDFEFMDDSNSYMQFSFSAEHGSIVIPDLISMTLVSGANESHQMTYFGPVLKVIKTLQKLIYRPDTDYAGLDTITFTTNDLGSAGIGGALSDSDTVAVKVNAPPLAQDDEYYIWWKDTLVVAAPGLLENDSDFNLDPITATLAGAPAGGELTLNGDGSFEYTPPISYTGDITFTYQLTDGRLNSNIAQALISVEGDMEADLSFEYIGDDITYTYTVTNPTKHLVFKDLALTFDVGAGGEVLGVNGGSYEASGGAYGNGVIRSGAIAEAGPGDIYVMSWTVRKTGIGDYLGSWDFDTSVTHLEGEVSVTVGQEMEADLTYQYTGDEITYTFTVTNPAEYRILQDLELIFNLGSGGEVISVTNGVYEASGGTLGNGLIRSIPIAYAPPGFVFVMNWTVRVTEAGEYPGNWSVDSTATHADGEVSVLVGELLQAKVTYQYTGDDLTYTFTVTNPTEERIFEDVELSFDFESEGQVSSARNGVYVPAGGAYGKGQVHSGETSIAVIPQFKPGDQIVMSWAAQPETSGVFSGTWNVDTSVTHQDGEVAVTVGEQLDADIAYQYIEDDITYTFTVTNPSARRIFKDVEVIFSLGEGGRVISVLNGAYEPKGGKSGFGLIRSIAIPEAKPGDRFVMIWTVRVARAGEYTGSWSLDTSVTHQDGDIAVTLGEEMQANITYQYFGDDITYTFTVTNPAENRMFSELELIFYPGVDGEVIAVNNGVYYKDTSEGIGNGLIHSNPIPLARPGDTFVMSWTVRVKSVGEYPGAWLFDTTSAIHISGGILIAVGQELHSDLSYQYVGDEISYVLSVMNSNQLRIFKDLEYIFNLGTGGEVISVTNGTHEATGGEFGNGLIRSAFFPEVKPGDCSAMTWIVKVTGSKEYAGSWSVDTSVTHLDGNVAIQLGQGLQTELTYQYFGDQVTFTFTVTNPNEYRIFQNLELIFDIGADGQVLSVTNGSYEPAGGVYGNGLIRSAAIPEVKPGDSLVVTWTMRLNGFGSYRGGWQLDASATHLDGNVDIYQLALPIILTRN